MSKVEQEKNITNEAVRFWYQSILNRYNSLNAANTGIDTKSGVILASAVAIAIYAVQTIDKPRLLAITGGVGLITAIILCLINMHVRNTSTEVHTTKEKEDYYDFDDETFYWQMIADLEDSVEKIDPMNKTKGKLYIWAVYLFVISSAFVVAAQYIKITVILGWE